MLSKQLINATKQHKDQMAGYLRTIGLYVGQDIFLLTVAKQGELSQTEIKERLGVEYSTVHKITERLQKGGFVTKVKDSSDKRVSKIRLTNKGSDIVKKIDRYWNQLEEEFFAPLNKEEKDQLNKLLQKLNS
jgi:MarR family transcriptional regulator, organic hydroperoxide resistance regulator